MSIRNIDTALASFDGLWEPHRLTSVNDYDVKIAKVQGDFIWHTHEETDEFFLVVSGRLTIQLRDGDIELGPNDTYVVPKGVEHCPRADEQTSILMIEPRGTVNTGNAPGERTSPLQEL